MKVRALVLTGFGINCDAETQFAFRRAGAEADRVHLNDIIEDTSILEGCQIMAVPGGFSFGDDVASGKILANRLRYKLGDPILRFVQDGKLIIGICNGFQVMVKMGILPMFDGAFVQETTLACNNSSRFEDRWVRLLRVPDTPCIWVKGIDGIELPVRHGEGKFVPRDDATLSRLRANGQVVFRYARADGAPARGAYPENPNGSIDDVAGICDPTGRLFGLMPHPEAFIEYTNHPHWYRGDSPKKGAGLRIFRNAIEYARDHLV